MFLCTILPFFIINFLPSLFKVASFSLNLLFLFCLAGVKSGLIKISLICKDINVIIDG